MRLWSEILRSLRGERVTVVLRTGVVVGRLVRVSPIILTNAYVEQRSCSRVVVSRSAVLYVFGPKSEKFIGELQEQLSDVGRAG